MQRTKAPFRADEVGSLLRPPRIKEARARLEKGEISADDLRKVEDSEIEKVVHKQASDRPEARHRRRIPPLLVAFRLSQVISPAANCFIPTRASSSPACRPGMTPSA